MKYDTSPLMDTGGKFWVYYCLTASTYIYHVQRVSKKTLYLSSISNDVTFSCFGNTGISFMSTAFLSYEIVI